MTLELDYDEAEQCLTEDSSAKLKTALNSYFTENGLPDQARDIKDETLREYAVIYAEEFGEACENFEQFGSFSPK